MEIKTALLCDYAFTDAAGKLCLIGIFDHLTIQPGSPGLISRAYLVAEVRAPVTEGSNHTLQMMFVNEDGHHEGPVVDVGVQLSAVGPRHPLGGTLLITIGPLPIPRPGEYAFELHRNGTRLASVPVLVTEASPVGRLPTGK